MPPKKKVSKSAPRKRASAPLAGDVSYSPPPVDAAETYASLLDSANSIAARDVRLFHADAHLARHNAGIGVASLRTMKSRIAKELPTVSFDDVERAFSYAVATEYAAAQVAAPTSSGDLATQLHEARVLRKLLLSSADVAAQAKLVDPKAVQRIQVGFGSFDTAQDLIDLGALFTKNAAALKGKTPVTAAQVARASQLGNALLGVLKPKAARKAQVGSPTSAVRDRFGTLLVGAYELLRRIGIWLWGELAVDEHVPPLLTRVGTSGKKTTPAPTDGTTPPATTQVAKTKKVRKRR